MNRKIDAIELVGECLDDLQVYIKFDDKSTLLIPVKVFVDMQTLSSSSYSYAQCTLDIKDYYNLHEINLEEPLSVATLEKIQAYIKEQLPKHNACTRCNAGVNAF